MPIPHRAAVCLFIVAAGIDGGCSKETAVPQQRPAPQVTVVTVTAQAIPQNFTFVAQTESSRQVNIVARVSGYLDRIAYDEGHVVKQGQILFELDRRPFEAQLDAAKGELQSQQARLKTAQANLARVKPLLCASFQRRLERGTFQLGKVRSALGSWHAISLVSGASPDFRW